MNLELHSWVYIAFLLALIVAFYVICVKYIGSFYIDKESITIISLLVLVITGIISLLIILLKRKKVKNHY